MCRLQTLRGGLLFAYTLALLKGYPQKVSLSLSLRPAPGRREDGEDGDDMDEWDQAKLEAVVAQKHGAEKCNANRATDIICKFFLDAVEGKQYGWCAPCCARRLRLCPPVPAAQQCVCVSMAAAKTSEGVYLF